MPKRNSYPTRLEEREAEMMELLSKRTGIPKGTIMTRAVEFALKPENREALLRWVLPAPDDVLREIDAFEKKKKSELPF